MYSAIGLKGFNIFHFVFLFAFVFQCVKCFFFYETKIILLLLLVSNILKFFNVCRLFIAILQEPLRII